MVDQRRSGLLITRVNMVMVLLVIIVAGTSSISGC